MTAGNRWSGSSSHPPPPPPPPAPILPPSSAIDANRQDDQSQRRPHHPPHHRQLEPFVDYPPNVPNGTTTTSPPYRSSGNPPGLPSLSSSSSTIPRTGADPGHSSNSPPLDSTNAYPYRRFEERQQLAPFGLQHISDVNQGLVTLPSISHTHMSTGGSGESRSPFGSSDALASMSRFSQHGGETFQDQLGRPQQDGASTTYHSQPFPTSDSFHSGGNTLPRTGSSHGNTHIGFSNLLTAERDGIAQFDPRRGGDAAGRGQGQGHQTAQASMHNPSAIGHDTELKRKRSEDDYAETSRARLPTLPGLTMSSLPPPPGFAPMPMQRPRGRSPSPALGSSLSHQPYSHHDQQKQQQQQQQQNLHHRDATRSGFRLVGDESAEIDQLDMEVDETEAAASETGQNKEDARKKKNRDKQRRLRMRRANQLQSLETTVGTQEVEIKRLSERSHNFEDRTRYTRAIFSDWVDALENRLKELGEPEAAIENLRNQYLGPLNAYNPDYGNTDSTFGGTSMSKSASSSNRISFSKDMSDSASTAPSTDRLAPINTRSVLALPTNIKGNDQSLSPHAIASLVTPSEYPSRRPQSENSDASRLNYGGLTRNPPWNWNSDIGHSSPQQHSTYPSSSQSKHVTDPSPDSARKGEREDETRSAPQGQRPDGHNGSHEARAFTTEYLARLQEDEVFDMMEPQINEIARALAEQRPPESKVDLEALGQETIDSAPPWRDDFTSAQILLLGRFLGMGSEQFPEIKARYVEQRLSTLSEHEKEVYKNWTRRKDRDRRIELLPDPVLRIRFIMLQESRSKGSSIIAFLCDLLHEALFFGPIWLTHLCELPESFLRRWSAIWPKDVDATVYCAQFRRRDSITGARAFDIILGSEGPRARKNASEIDLAAFTNDALS